MIELVANLILLGSAGLLLMSLVLGRCVKKNKKPTERIIDLTEAVRDAEIINGSFFRSLELVEKNLESLLARANRVEESLRTLLPQAETAKGDPYARASLFLAEGKDANEISQSLKIPLSQVKLIKELQEELEIKKGETIESVRKKEASKGEKATWNDLLEGFSPTGNHQVFLGEKVAAGNHGVR